MKQTLKKTIVLAFAFLLVAVGCGPGATYAPPAAPQPTSAAQGQAPEAVLKAITDALNKGDVETATALLADDVTQTLIPPPSGTGIYQGKEAMRARFKEVIALNAYHKFGKCDTEGDKVICAVTYSDDSTKPLGFDLEMKAEAVVQNGLLKTVTWTMTDASLSKMQAAMAAAQPQAMTITYADNNCTMNGPQKVPVGMLSIDWNILDKESNDVFGLCAVTLDAGKSIDDLDQAPGFPQPSWVTVVDCWSGAPSYRKTVSTEVKRNPIYFVCFSSYTTKIGALGPIEVGK